MNNLENEIKEYLIDNDLTDKSVNQIADEFYVSRAYIYKVINKLGFNSYRDMKFQKQLKSEMPMKRTSEIQEISSNALDNIVYEIKSCNMVFILGCGLSKVSAEYFGSQLLNLGYFALWFWDIKQYKEYLNMKKKSSLTIIVSSSGVIEPQVKRILTESNKTYAVTVLDSELYNTATNVVGFNSKVDKLSDKFSRENQVDLLLVLHQILLGIEDGIGGR